MKPAATPLEPSYVEATACPFCDSINLTIEGPLFVVICRECGATGPCDKKTPQEAARQWNQRRPSGPLQFVEVELPS